MFILHILKVIGYSLLVFMIGLTVVAHAMWFLEKNDNRARSFPVDYKKGHYGCLLVGDCDDDNGWLR